jgi:hypothetical protein
VNDLLPHVTMNEWSRLSSEVQASRVSNVKHAKSPGGEPTYTIQKCINYAPTCTKKSVINMYHKQVHPTMYQVYTNHVSTTHQ